jgi:SAM-dependent methyltransferase
LDAALVCLAHRIEQGDAAKLPANLSKFDAIVVADLLQHLPDPAAFLEGLPWLLRRRGIVVLAVSHLWPKAAVPASAAGTGATLSEVGPVITETNRIHFGPVWHAEQDIWSLFGSH